MEENKLTCEKNVEKMDKSSDESLKDKSYEEFLCQVSY